jgi:hypothetical protein
MWIMGMALGAHFDPRIPNLASIPRSCRGFVDPLEIGRKSLGDFCGNAIKMVESSM